MPPVSLPEIVFLHLPRSEALEALIRRRAAHLLQYCQELHGCRVVVAQPQRHHRQGRAFEVRIEVRLNGQTLVVDRTRDEDVYLALRDAFDDMVRQVEDTVRRRRAGPRHRETVRRLPDGAKAAEQGTALNGPGLGDEPVESAEAPGRA